MEYILRVLFFISFGVTSVTSFIVIDENEFETGYFLFNYIPCNVTVAENRTYFDVDCESNNLKYRVRIVKTTLSVFEYAKIRSYSNHTVHTLSPEGLGFVEGVIENETFSFARGELADVFHGVLQLNNELYTLQPADEFFNNTDFNSILYKPGDLNVSHVCEVINELPKTPTSLTGLCDNDTSSAPMPRDFSGPDSSSSNDSLTPRVQTSPFNPIYYNKVCPLRIIVDHTFFKEIGSRNKNKTLAYVAALINKVDEIFQSTDFNFDGKADNVGFVIKQLDIYEEADVGRSSNPLRYYKGDDANNYLGLLSHLDFNDVCLGLGLTSTEFTGGTVGMAYVAHVEQYIAGGMCDRRMTSGSSSKSNNAVIVSLKSPDRILSMKEAVIVLAHELGHAYGATHDQSPCVPDYTQGGKFLMYSKMQSGNMVNNRQFSPCSREVINKVLSRKMRKHPFCMITRNDSIALSSRLMIILTLVVFAFQMKP